jgi:hypothetical protein
MNFIYDNSPGIMFGELKEIISKILELFKKVIIPNIVRNISEVNFQ